MGWYLPDFWLPDQKLWVEPKGQDPTDEEQRKCFFLADMSGAPVVCCFGPVGYGRVERYKGFPEEAATYQMNVYTGYYAPDQFATIREALFSDEFDPKTPLNN
jgi:hypothetical protein